MIHLYGEVGESIHLFLPALPLAETALREINVDPARVSLRYDGGFRDSLIEQIARNIHAEMLNPAPAGKMLVEPWPRRLAPTSCETTPTWSPHRYRCRWPAARSTPGVSSGSRI